MKKYLRINRWNSFGIVNINIGTFSRKSFFHQFSLSSNVINESEFRWFWNRHELLSRLGLNNQSRSTAPLRICVRFLLRRCACVCGTHGAAMFLYPFLYNFVCRRFTQSYLSVFVLFWLIFWFLVGLNITTPCHISGATKRNNARKWKNNDVSERDCVCVINDRVLRKASETQSILYKNIAFITS